MGEPVINIDQMSADDRLRLLEAIWESLGPRDVPLTPNQRDELDRRLDEVESDDAGGIPWEEVLRNVRRRAG